MINKRFEEAQERPARVKDLTNHPLKMIGTLIDGHDVVYVIRADSKSKETSVGNTVLNGKGGICFLVQDKSCDANKKINLTVFPAGEVLVEGVTYPCFTLDPTDAYNIAHRL